MRLTITIFALLVLLGLGSGAVADAYASEGKWPGVDDTVVERVAEEYGRGSTGSLINIEGDAQLFAFLMAGVIGGFAVGFFYKGLFGKTTPRESGPGKDAGDA